MIKYKNKVKIINYLDEDVSGKLWELVECKLGSNWADDEY